MSHSPFAAIEMLLIDGNNLLHRRSGDAGEGALRGLLPRLSAAIPTTINTIVMLDGHPATGGGRAQLIRRGLEIRHSGSLSADDVLLNLIRERTRMTTLVTDDRGLTEKARHLGCHTYRLDWLESLLTPAQPRPGQSRPVSLGNRRPPGPRPNR